MSRRKEGTKMNIGKTIAELRKNNNMTQSEVANHLNVSYQAVSKWERDESLPDISLLPQLADLFHVSIDYLIRQEQSTEKVVLHQDDEVDHAIEEQIDDVTQLVNEAFSNGLPSADELSEKITNYFTQAFNNFTPFMKPKDIKDMVIKTSTDFNDVSDESYEYLDQDTIEILLDSIVGVDDEVVEKFEELLPMCNASNKEKIVEILCENDFYDYELDDLIVFLNSSQKYKLIEHHFEDLNDDKIEQIADLMPLIHSEAKRLLVDKIIEGDDFDYEISELMPFLNSEHKNLLVDWITDHDECYDDLEDCFVFFNKEQKKACLNWAKDKMDYDDLMDLFNI